MSLHDITADWWTHTLRDDAKRSVSPAERYEVRSPSRALGLVGSRSPSPASLRGSKQGIDIKHLLAIPSPARAPPMSPAQRGPLARGRDAIPGHVRDGAGRKDSRDEQVQALANIARTMHATPGRGAAGMLTKPASLSPPGARDTTHPALAQDPLMVARKFHAGQLKPGYGHGHGDGDEQGSHAGRADATQSHGLHGDPSSLSSAPGSDPTGLSWSTGGPHDPLHDPHGLAQHGRGQHDGHTAPGSSASSVVPSDPSHSRRASASSAVDEGSSGHSGVHRRGPHAAHSGNMQGQGAVPGLATYMDSTGAAAGIVAEISALSRSFARSQSAGRQGTPQAATVGSEWQSSPPLAQTVQLTHSTSAQKTSVSTTPQSSGSNRRAASVVSTSGFSAGTASIAGLGGLDVDAALWTATHRPAVPPMPMQGLPRVHYDPQLEGAAVALTGHSTTAGAAAASASAQAGRRSSVTRLAERTHSPVTSSAPHDATDGGMIHAFGHIRPSLAIHHAAHAHALPVSPPASSTAAQSTGESSGFGAANIPQPPTPSLVDASPPQPLTPMRQAAVLAAQVAVAHGSFAAAGPETTEALVHAALHSTVFSPTDGRVRSPSPRASVQAGSASGVSNPTATVAPQTRRRLSSHDGHRTCHGGHERKPEVPRQRRRGASSSSSASSVAGTSAPPSPATGQASSATSSPWHEQAAPQQALDSAPIPPMLQVSGLQEEPAGHTQPLPPSDGAVPAQAVIPSAPGQTGLGGGPRPWTVLLTAIVTALVLLAAVAAVDYHTGQSVVLATVSAAYGLGQQAVQALRPATVVEEPVTAKPSATVPQPQPTVTATQPVTASATKDTAHSSRWSSLALWPVYNTQPEQDPAVHPGAAAKATAASVAVPTTIAAGPVKAEQDSPRGHIWGAVSSMLHREDEKPQPQVQGQHAAPAVVQAAPAPTQVPASTADQPTATTTTLSVSGRVSSLVSWAMPHHEEHVAMKEGGKTNSDDGHRDSGGQKGEQQPSKAAPAAATAEIHVEPMPSQAAGTQQPRGLSAAVRSLARPLVALIAAPATEPSDSHSGIGQEPQADTHTVPTKDVQQQSARVSVARPVVHDSPASTPVPEVKVTAGQAGQTHASTAASPQQPVPSATARTWAATMLYIIAGALVLVIVAMTGAGLLPDAVRLAMRPVLDPALREVRRALGPMQARLAQVDPMAVLQAGKNGLVNRLAQLQVAARAAVARAVAASSRQGAAPASAAVNLPGARDAAAAAGRARINSRLGMPASSGTVTPTAQSSSGTARGRTGRSPARGSAAKAAPKATRTAAGAGTGLLFPGASPGQVARGRNPAPRPGHATPRGRTPGPLGSDKRGRSSTPGRAKAAATGKRSQQQHLGTRCRAASGSVTLQ